MIKFYDHRGLIFVRSSGKWHLIDTMDEMDVYTSCGRIIDHMNRVLEFGGILEAVLRYGICKECLDMVKKFMEKTDKKMLDAINAKI